MSSDGGVEVKSDNTPGTSPPSPPEQDLYTTFKPSLRRYLPLLLGYTCLASSLTATIYFPLIPPLAEHFEVSIQAINLTITAYLIFQAISPAFFAAFSDSFGRRPVLLLTLSIYFVASLGLALNRRSYAALLVLRALQSFGGSAVMSIAYGVVADVAVSSERGKMVAPMLAATNLGPCIGPVIGGWIAFGSRQFVWCFWALVIFAGTSLLLVGFTLPETGRMIVGNGSLPTHGVWRTWWSLATAAQLHSHDVETHREKERHFQASPKPAKQYLDMLRSSNPLTCLRILAYPDTAVTLWLAASAYAIWYCVQTTIPLAFDQIYHYNELQVGLSYLTGGVGVVVGGFIAGRLMDWNYKAVAKKHGLSINRTAGDDITHFPIEEARSRGSLVLLGLSTVILCAYGWSLEARLHASVPLILQFFLGAICTILHQIYNVLMVDIFPKNSSSAAASGNITRCALSAVAVAILHPLTRVIGRGWFFAAMALLNGVIGALAVIFLRVKGQSCRDRRLLD